MIKWLESEAVQKRRPARHKGSASVENATLKVEPSKGERIQVVLANAAGTHSLEFAAGATQSKLAGAFRLRSVRFAKHDGKRAWMLSTTAAPKKRIRLSSDKARVIKGDAALDFTGRVQRKPRELFLGFGLACRKRGVTIYRDGRRVPITYTIRNREGAKLRGGRMNYG